MTIPDPPVLLHCVDCGQEFTDLEEYQDHVHREAQAPARGCAWGCLLSLILWSAVIALGLIVLTGRHF